MNRVQNSRGWLSLRRLPLSNWSEPGVMPASAFQRAVEREQALALRGLRTFALVVFSPGDSGSSELPQLARTLTSRVRVSDIVGRIDTDRLAVLLPETDRNAAWTFADSVLSKLAEAELGFDVEVHVSPVKGGSSSGSDGPKNGAGSGSSRRAYSGNGGVDHAGNAGVDHAGNAGVDHSGNAGVDHSGNGDVDHSANGGVDHSANGGVDHSANRGVDPAANQDTEGLADEAEALADSTSCPLQAARGSTESRPVGDISEAFLMPLSRRKRAFDLVGSLTLLVFLSPLFAVVAIAVKLTSPGPVFFKQRRAGLGGKPFDFFKFRTMRNDADGQKGRLRQQNEKDGPIFKIRRDPRITPLGRFLRSTSIDELPQLWNVLIGDMSLVGPRPPTMDEVEEYEPWQRQRLDLTGGLTCIWQVSGRSEVGFRDWVRMDIQYARKRGAWLDVSLLARTVGAVLSRRGAW